MKIHVITATPLQIARLFSPYIPEINDTSRLEIAALTSDGHNRLVFRTGGGVSEGDVHIKFPDVVAPASIPVAGLDVAHGPDESRKQTESPRNKGGRPRKTQAQAEAEGEA